MKTGWREGVTIMWWVADVLPWVSTGSGSLTRADLVWPINYMVLKPPTHRHTAVMWFYIPTTAYLKILLPGRSARAMVARPYRPDFLKRFSPSLIVLKNPFCFGSSNNHIAPSEILLPCNATNQSGPLWYLASS